MSSRQYLSDDEVRELCEPLTQPAAMIRHLRDAIGVAGIKRKPNGMPLVHRQALDRAFGIKPAAPVVGPSGTRPTLNLVPGPKR